MPGVGPDVPVREDLRQPAPGGRPRHLAVPHSRLHMVNTSMFPYHVVLPRTCCQYQVSLLRCRAGGLIKSVSMPHAG